MRKLSIIRGKDVAECPYGLSIIDACEDVGNAILTMQVLEFVDEDEIEQTINRNKVIYLTQKIGERCPFANEIMKNYNKVDCSFSDTAAGEGTYHLTPSPLYPRIFIGDGLEPGSSNKGQIINDPRLYFDAPERDIDVPFGLYSIFSDYSNEDRLLKIADKYTNKIAYNARYKIGLLRDKYYNVLAELMRNSPIKTLDEKELIYLLNVINQW